MTALVSAVALAAAVLIAWPPSASSSRLERIARSSRSGGARPPTAGRAGTPRQQASTLRRITASGRWAPAVPGVAGFFSRRGRSGRRTLVPGPSLADLVAEVVAAGVPPARALQAVAECVEPVDGPAAAELFSLAASVATGTPAVPPTARTAADQVRRFRALAAAVDLAVMTGAGPVGLIRAAAEDERRREHVARVQAARRVGVTVLLPTGLCLLPAFVLLTVAPLVIELVVG